MNIVDCILAYYIYIVALGCVLYYINKIQMDKLKRNSKPINKVHFYVARDKIGDQCLIVKQHPSSTVATYYVPDGNDMFAKDWMVL